MSFETFWSAWPGPKTRNYHEYTRKKDRPKCEKKWKDLKLDERSAEIIQNVELRAKYDKGWLKDNGKYLEAPLVYLNNQRWNDEWADIRDKVRSRYEPAEEKPKDEGPKISRWARYANLVLFQLAYKNRSRGFKPIGDSLPRVLELKAKLVKSAEDAFWNGDPFEDEDYKDMVYSALTEALEG